ncbi:Uncharacterised protein [Escherichia coli]|nr:Uncharacterised protein [Escherichia coli]
MVLREVDHLIILNTVLTLLLQALIRTLYRVLLQAQVHTHILSVLVLIRTPLRLVHMDIPSPLTLLVTRKTPVKNIAFNYIVRLA